MDILTPVLIFIVVLVIWHGMQTQAGQKINRFLPTPFWIYFIPILLSTFGFLPQKSLTYSILGLHGLPLALVLLLIGTPLGSFFRLGLSTLKAIGLALSSMFIGAVVSYLCLASIMPDDAWRSVGALLATWTGGSANLLAVKEILGVSEQQFAPLVIVDTFLSYGWLALLILGAGYQAKFDRNVPVSINAESKVERGESPSKLSNQWPPKIGVLFLGLVVSELMLLLGGILNPAVPLLSVKAWTVLLSTTVAIGLASTPLRKVEAYGASTMGTFILYLVLASIGAKTQLTAAVEAPVYLVFGMLMLTIHGGILFSLGRFIKTPLYLLATASQANVGGPVSAPIVAGVYRPGSSHFGVLMALVAAVLGTYIGTLGGWVCRQIDLLIR